MQDKDIKNARKAILDWYDRHKRALPWRDINDPYKTWLSEIMLQQTTVTAVKPYYEKFLAKWPSIKDLAAAAQDEVMHEWAGLGYYSRARNLHKCAIEVTREHDGQFPQDQAALKKLPGIGDYTSAAIMTIAFNKPATVMDGNIERVTARLHRIAEPLPKAKTTLKTLSAPLFNTKRPGDMAQALMDIGATICTPKNPKCMICPISQYCEAKRAGDMESYPVKLKKKKRPSKIGYVYWIERDNQILLERRPETGLLAGTLGLPTSKWDINKPEHPHDNIEDLNISIHHVFTHFDLELKLFKAQIKTVKNNQSWHALNAPETQGLPSLFAKVYKQILNAVQ